MGEAKPTNNGHPLILGELQPKQKFRFFISVVQLFLTVQKSWQTRGSLSDMVGSLHPKWQLGVMESITI